MARRFAEDTKVSSSQTQGEIKEALKKAGADQIAIFESKEQSSVAFSLGNGVYRLTAPTDPKAKDPDQDERRVWRLLGLLIKAKLSAVAEGATTIEREFLADWILYDGQTVSEKIVPELRLAHQEGRMPKNLLLGGPKK